MHLLFRVDNKAGQGHLKRCQALMESWPRTGKALQWDADDSLTIDPDSWFVFDGYGFTEDDHKKTKDAGYHLLVIDDNAHLPRYHADILLNYNVYAPSLKYRTDRATKLLLGPQYALIRREFRDYPLYRTIPPIAQNILVAPGSAATEELRRIVRIALGQVECQYRILEGADDVPAQMAWADLLITAAGVTVYEAAFMGLPTLLVVTAVNQARNAPALHEVGVAWNLGVAAGLSVRDVLSLVGWAQGNEVWRRSASEAGATLVDGKGAERVVEAMLER